MMHHHRVLDTPVVSVSGIEADQWSADGSGITHMMRNILVAVDASSVGNVSICVCFTCWPMSACKSHVFVLASHGVT